MKITLPSVAIIDDDLEANLSLGSTMRGVMPCDFDTHLSLPEFLESKRPQDYQLAVVDPRCFRGTDLVQGLAMLQRAAPKAQIILSSNQHYTEQELKLVNNLRLAHFLDKPLPGEGFGRMMDEAKQLIGLMKRKRTIRMGTPIGLYGSGIVITELAKRLSEEDNLEVFWYGKSLATHRYHYFEEDTQKTDKNLSYKDLMLLKDFPVQSKINCMNSFSDLLKAQPGIIVFGSALQKPLNIAPGLDRSSLAFLKELYKNSAPNFDELLYEMAKRGSDANLVVVSNPPEVLAYRALMTGFDKGGLLTASPDVNRAKKLLRGHEITLLGSHAKQIFEPGLCTKDGRSIEESMKEDGIFRHLDAKKFVENKLNSWGVDLMVAYGNRGIRFGYDSIGYEDAAAAVKEGILDILTFNPPLAFSCYRSGFDAFLHGPPPEVLYWENGFHFQETLEKDYSSRYKKKIAGPKIHTQLEEIATMQRELAMIDPSTI